MAILQSVTSFLCPFSLFYDHHVVPKDTAARLLQYYCNFENPKAESKCGSKAKCTKKFFCADRDRQRTLLVQTVLFRTYYTRNTATVDHSLLSAASSPNEVSLVYRICTVSVERRNWYQFLRRCPETVQFLRSAETAPQFLRSVETQPQPVSAEHRYWGFTIRNRVQNQTQFLCSAETEYQFLRWLHSFCAAQKLGLSFYGAQKLGSVSAQMWLELGLTYVWGPCTFWQSYYILITLVRRRHYFFLPPKPSTAHINILQYVATI